MSSEETLLTRILNSLDRRSQNPVWVTGQQSHTGREMLDRIFQHSQRLTEQGVGKKSKVYIAVDKKIDFFLSFVSALMVRATPVLLGPNFRQSKIDDKGDGILLTSSVDLQISQQDLTFNLDHFFKQYDKEAAEDLALGLYTSGSTGVEKLIFHSHKSLLYASDNSPSSLVIIGAKERITLGYLPYYHLAGFYNLISMPFLAGDKLVECEPGNPLKLFKQINDETITDILLVVSIVRALATIPTIKPVDREMLVWLGGDIVTADDIDQTRRLFPKAHIFCCYAMTEVPRITCHSVGLNPEKSGSVGLPPKGTQVKVVSPQDDIDLRPGEEGEICVKSPALYEVSIGERIGSDWLGTGQSYFRTGDLGYIDTGGFLFITGRKKNLIKCNGLSIYPEKLERIFINANPSLEIFVVGVPNSIVGEIPVGLFSREKAYDIDAINNVIELYLNPEERPRSFYSVDYIPKTSIGKVDRKKLQQLAVTLSNK